MAVWISDLPEDMIEKKLFYDLKFNESNAVEAWVEMEGRRSVGIYRR
jgi:hypothetical protein